jgi:hypothetical protein
MGACEPSSDRFGTAFSRKGERTKGVEATSLVGYLRAMVKLRSIAIICAVLCATAPAHAQTPPLAAAKAFVSGLYAGYAKGREPDYLGRDARKAFAPALLALIDQDQRTTPAGDVGALDGDPICDCQDAGGLKLTGLKVSPAGASQARADVAFSLDGDRRRLRFDLVPTAAGWRIADIHSADTPSLVQLLQQELRHRQHGRRPR